MEFQEGVPGVYLPWRIHIVTDINRSFGAVNASFRIGYSRFHLMGNMGKEENFYILKNTVSSAVLTENFFMDTEKDCRFIMSGKGRQKVAEMHVKAIRRVITIE
jgi:hypothetical protein